MKPMIRDTYGRNALSSAMQLLLGVTNGKYPAEGLPPRIVQGVKVWVEPLPPAQPGQKKRSTHRVKCECPKCGHVMSAGRMHQHKCDARNRRRAGIAAIIWLQAACGVKESRASAAAEWDAMSASDRSKTLLTRQIMGALSRGI